MTREEGVLKFNLANWKRSEDDVIINVIVPIINSYYVSRCRRIQKYQSSTGFNK
eukprot:UN17835